MQSGGGGESVAGSANRRSPFVYYINASYYFYHCLCELPHGNLIEKYNVLKDMIGASTNSFLVTSSCYGRLQTQTICVLISHVVMNHI